jgi:hypothetical protein
MSRAQAMITPETAPTKRKMIHVSKARPQKSSFMRALPARPFLWQAEALPCLGLPEVQNQVHPT